MIALCSWIAHTLVPHAGATVVFAVFATIVTAFAVATAVQVIPAALQARVLDAVTVPLLPALIAVVVVLEGATVSMSASTGSDLARYFAGVVYGLLIAVPAVVTVALLTLPRGPKRVSPPVLAYARAGLCARAERLAQSTPKAEPEPWRIFATVSIVMSIVPPVAVVLALIATWQRRGRGDTGRALITGAWTTIMVAALLEVALLVLLPFYGAALGWFTLR
ncbi:hypothetical protein [Microbacterium sp. EF45047]|uniref:hypothetical protein n=1 Tax=Microbacterium sp. EF45047 TaxID=2809708 RepID=UPI002349E632|nr:hypothetical protein [Microbacterium sp. EF45047]WCM55671.1 hypothetical protein JRG78_12325 [Microbacterium sp. EF45047]